MFNSELGFNIFEKIYNQSKLFADAFEGIFVGLQTSKDDLYILEKIDDDSFKFKVPISGKEYELENEEYTEFKYSKKNEEIIVNLSSENNHTNIIFKTTN
jgi:hypothetical protein